MEILAIGTELLLGETIDGNGAWLGSRLAREGIAVTRRAVVADDAAAIRSAAAEALRRTGIVLCTGGLGPTPDDLTKPVFADLFDRSMVLDEGWLEVVRQRFRDRGRVMPEINRNQAEIPSGATVFPNAYGTAPGLALDDADLGIAILLPGVPAEMRGLFEDHVLGYLVARMELRPAPIVSRVIRTTGIAESELAERVADLAGELDPLTMAFLPGPSGSDIRLTSWGMLSAAGAANALDAAEARMRERLGGVVYGRDGDDLATVVGDMLRARHATLAIAESCTGGLLGKRLTDAPGASDFLIGGFVTYANEAKTGLLSVDPEILRRHGAVSEETARAMAAGARQALSADWGISITGVAGPGGGSSEKPVGTVFIALAAAGIAEVRRLRLGGDRAEIRERATQAALSLLRRTLAEVRS